MIITPGHPESHRYMAVLGSQRLTRLTRLDTETKEFTQQTGDQVVEGTADSIYYRSLNGGQAQWEKIDG
jgi:hypothetical protein